MPKYYEKQGLQPLFIAHRGSMGYFPEHTLLAYYYAHFEGVQFIDCDIHPTKDGDLVIHHETTLTEDLTGKELYPEIFTEALKVNFTNDLYGD
jgi:glycerophosphoryl diester phosphodiesterase